MEERTYFISEVSGMVGVEPHVLRYWEEELGFSIGRNSQGKRCYTDADVERFREVKFWRDKGMQLRAVKEFLEEPVRVPVPEAEWNPEDASETGQQGQQSGQEVFSEESGASLVTVEDPAAALQKFENLLDAIIGRALERNNDRLVREICDSLLRELDERLEVRLEENARRERLARILQEGLRESAAEAEGGRRSFWKRWKEWAERKLRGGNGRV